MEMSRKEILAATFCNHKVNYKLIVFDCGVRKDGYLLGVYRDIECIHIHVFTKKKD